MDKSELEHSRRFAATFRNRGGFGAGFVRLGGTTGDWKKGKDYFSRQIIADVPDAMHGFQTFENSRPCYCVRRIADGRQPPQENSSENWKRVVLMPVYDSETHEPYLFTSTGKLAQIELRTRGGGHDR
jgi:hypothetical protein